MNHHFHLEVVARVRVIRRRISRLVCRGSNAATIVDNKEPRSGSSVEKPLLTQRVIGQQNNHLLLSRQPERR